MVKPTRSINWAHVAANAVVLTLAGAGALYFSTYQPKPFSERELAASRARGLANCGAGMFDVTPQAPQCPLFDSISLQSEPCMGPGCEAFDLTLHADGRAQLDVTSPQEESGLYRASVGRAEFRQLANLVASLRLDRRGGHDPSLPDAGSHVVRAGCKGNWSFGVNYGGGPGEIEAIQRCLLDVKQRADWSKVSPADGATVPSTID